VGSAAQRSLLDKHATAGRRARRTPDDAPAAIARRPPAAVMARINALCRPRYFATVQCAPARWLAARNSRSLLWLCRTSCCFCSPINAPCIVCTTARCSVRPPLTRLRSSESLPQFCRANTRTPASTSSPLTAASRPLCREVALPPKAHRLLRHWPLLAGEGSAQTARQQPLVSVSPTCPKTASRGGPAAFDRPRVRNGGQGLQCWHRSHAGCWPIAADRAWSPRSDRRSRSHGTET
jgi:hypothetical protein